MDYNSNHLKTTSKTTVTFSGPIYITDGLKAGAQLAKNLIQFAN